MIGTILIVFATFQIIQGISPPTNLTIEINNNRQEFYISYDRFIETEGVYQRYILYNIIIYYNQVLFLNFWDDWYFHSIYNMPERCMDVDVYVAMIDEDFVLSDYAHAKERAYPEEFPEIEIEDVSSRKKESFIFKPPQEFARCPLTYDVELEYEGEVFEKLTTNGPLYEFDFVRERFFCKTLKVNITPKLEEAGLIGEAISFEKHTDHLMHFFDMGPPVNLNLEVFADVLQIEWIAPTDYETCDVKYVILIFNSATDEHIETLFDLDNSPVLYNYFEKGVYCISARINVTSKIQERVGGSVEEIIWLPPPEGENCEM